MIGTIAQGLIDPLTSSVSKINIPMQPDVSRGWKPIHLFKGSTSILHHISCHASVLIPGPSPHPPHTHEDEEILIMMDGEADLIFPGKSPPNQVERHRLVSGQWVYYPSGFPHTIEAAGTQPANYLMVRWTGPKGNYGNTLPFQTFDFAAMKRELKVGNGFRSFRFMDGPTSGLRKLEGHLSTLAPSSGYDPHADKHDVLLVILEGEVETLGHQVGPHGVVFYRAGDPHGIRNTGEMTSRYLAFEFHGTEIPISQPWPIRMVAGTARMVLPRSLRVRLGRVLGRIGRRLGIG